MNVDAPFILKQTTFVFIPQFFKYNNIFFCIKFGTKAARMKEWGIFSKSDFFIDFFGLGYTLKSRPRAPPQEAMRTKNRRMHLKSKVLAA